MQSSGNYHRRFIVKRFIALLAALTLMSVPVSAQAGLVGKGCTMWPYPGHNNPGFNPLVTTAFIVWDPATKEYQQDFCQIPDYPDPNVYGKPLYVGPPTSVYPVELLFTLRYAANHQTQWRREPHRLPYAQERFLAICFWYGNCPK